MDAALMVDETSLETAASGAVTGRLWFGDGDEGFPDVGWFDFPVVIVAAWLEVLARIRPGAKVREQLHFMDGPYRVVARLSDPLTLQLDVVCTRGRGQTTSTSLGFADALDRGIDVARVLLAACARQGWRNRDIEDLEGAKRAAEGRREALRDG